MLLSHPQACCSQTHQGVAVAVCRDPGSPEMVLEILGHSPLQHKQLQFEGAVVLVIPLQRVCRLQLA